jgi:predicted SAM-dependent methyltransferase
MKLNLGCGSQHFEGYVNMDKDDYGQEIKRNVLRGIPFSDDTFDEVYTAHFMEHIPNGEDVYFVISEIWRVCKPGAIFKIIVPHSSTLLAFFPDHLSYWNEEVLHAIISDPYKKEKGHKYNFKILNFERVIYELRADLEVIK